MARIREATGRTIPLASLFQGATVEYLARLLQPFYAFQAAGLDGERESHTGIEERATDYIEAMGRVQPIGPYLLGGWSMGGVVAYEMAQQLESQGHKVALVALLDSFAPDPDDKLATDDLQLLAHFIQNLGLPPDELRIHQDGAAQLEAGDLLSHILEEAKAASLAPPDMGLAEAQRLFHVFKTNLRAMSSYSPKPYRGKIVLFKASEFMMKASQDSALGWQHFAPEGIDVYSTKGNRNKMMRDPNVKELAGQLRAFIERIKDG